MLWINWSVDQSGCKITAAHLCIWGLIKVFLFAPGRRRRLRANRRRLCSLSCCPSWPAPLRVLQQTTWWRLRPPSTPPPWARSRFLVRRQEGGPHTVLPAGPSIRKKKMFVWHFWPEISGEREGHDMRWLFGLFNWKFYGNNMNRTKSLRKMRLLKTNPAAQSIDQFC